MSSGWLRGSLLTGLSVGLLIASGSVAADDEHRRMGDFVRAAMPAGVAAYELWRGDREGLGQFGRSWLLTLAATEVLKRGTRIERPDRTDDLSFPSGHAAHAFAAATYMHRRHGFDQARLWYVAAGYVGWTRVQANRHRWVDIAGSAVLSAASTWWLVDPAGHRGVTVLPVAAPGLLAVEVRAVW